MPSTPDPRNPAHPAADADELARLAASEGWLAPPPEIQRNTRLRPWQRVLFWALRVYIIGMTALVVWAFATGHVAGRG